MSDFIQIIAIIAGIYLAAKAVFFLAGFKSTGIARGSYGATMMSRAAVASGGAVSSGSIVAISQRFGTGFRLSEFATFFAVVALGYIAVKLYF
ncbi:interferon-induced 6-16 family protein (macronuclear) [Tetrahymena thermophila SB210]|uniref:Interferon-induced 6-16 family protein n=1 Tax=Tetrahymena thermophila (strain SB210) TaxID=312017 RepID=W7XE72_TETTS|nr:interferon-induced 6-16 family protein [Tetrahymena thermophila SB210]EWS74848.1 interferon-induced 6-16 family protein [Tetrahymena thermophila SB210]|eukprot:XP_012652561.1 interferon-induced 6-16 family protein [Tetrahymena thermophila SB210]